MTVFSMTVFSTTVFSMLSMMTVLSMQWTVRQWGRQDSNLRRLSHQIYSLAPLATRVHPPPCVAVIRQELAEGFEPTTAGLQNRCSAVELR